MAGNKIKLTEKNVILKKISEQKLLLLLMLVFMIYFIVFRYLPIAGWVMAFQNYKPHLGFTGSEWVGLKHFNELFGDPDFFRAIRNTIGMSIIRLIFGFISSIGLAILLNEVKNAAFKRFTQTVSYLPHFVSWVVAATIVTTSLERDGIVNIFFTSLGFLKEPVLWLGEEKYFWLIIALSDMWKEVGWNAIIYLAAISAIDINQYEASIVDGAGRLRRIWHITLPGMMPTIILMIILNIGLLLGTFTLVEQVMLLDNPMVIKVAETIDLYTLRLGMKLFRFSFAASAGIFKSLVSVILVFTANAIAKKLGQRALI